MHAFFLMTRSPRSVEQPWLRVIAAARRGCRRSRRPTRSILGAASVGRRHGPLRRTAARRPVMLGLAVLGDPAEHLLPHEAAGAADLVARELAAGGQVIDPVLV